MLLSWLFVIDIYAFDADFNLDFNLIFFDVILEA